jgi:O-antigen/teichoic acid export membrane protein
MAGSALAGGTGVVVTWVVARALGTSDAGAFFAATAVFVLVGGLAKLGTQTGLVYWPARLRATGRTDLLGACLRTGLVPVVVFSVLLAAALWLAAPLLAQHPAPESGEVAARYTDVLRVLALFLPLLALTDALLTATRGYRAMRPTVIYDRVLRSALQLVLVGAAGVATLWTVVALPVMVAAWALPYLPVVVLSAYALRKVYLDTRPPGVTPTRVERRELRRDFWRFTGPRAVASVAQLALQRVDVLLVAALGGLSAAAMYAVAGRFVVLIQFANQGISQSVQPRLAEALATGDRDTANHLYQTATGWLVLVTWPINFLVILLAPVYLRIFGESYTDGVPVVLVLASAMLVATGCGMVDMVLAMAGRTSWNLVNVLVALALTIGLDLLLIPRLGALGAAIGLAVAMLANNLLPLIQVGRSVRLHPFGRGMRIAALLSVACFGVLPWTVALLAGAMHRTPALMAAVSAISAVVAVAAFAAGVWRWREALALDAFKPTRRTT